MLTQQRHEIILKLLKEKGSITVTEVRDLLDTSESTVRRDITALDKEGKLEKVFGGAVEAGQKGAHVHADDIALLEHPGTRDAVDDLVVNGHAYAGGIAVVV